MNKLFKDIYKGKRVLVTGDTGFKGSWLCIWLHELGADVYGYALAPKTERDNFVRTNLSEVIHHHDGDIRNQSNVMDFFADVKPDIVFHLAAQALVIPSYQDPVETFSTNIMGTINFLEAVRKTPSVKAAVNVTSDKCYLNQNWEWGYRESDPMGGHDPYSSSKGCSELVTQSYSKSFFNADQKCHVATARAGNVIGGGDWSEYRIVPDFYRALIKDKPITVRNPNATRPWQHVLEPLSGYLLLAVKLLTEGDKFSGGWNFGPGDSQNYKVMEVIERIVQKVPGSQYEVLENPERFYESQSLKLDISKAVALLGWKPRLDFEETIDFTIAGYKDELEGKNVYESRVRQINQYMTK